LTFNLPVNIRLRYFGIQLHAPTSKHKTSLELMRERMEEQKRLSEQRGMDALARLKDWTQGLQTQRQV
jgi:hypothetical protein